MQPVGSAPYVQDVLLIQGARFWIGFDDALTGFVFRKPGVVISNIQLTPSRLATEGQAIYWSTADNLRMYTIGTSTLSDLLPAATDGATRVNGVAVDPAGVGLRGSRFA